MASVHQVKLWGPWTLAYYSPTSGVEVREFKTQSLAVNVAETLLDSDPTLAITVARELRSDNAGWDVFFIDPSGKQRTKRFRTKTEAKAFSAAVETDVRRGHFIDAAAGRQTLEEYARWCIARRSLAATSRQAMEHRMTKHVYPTIGQYRLGDITPEVIIDWLASLTVGPSTKHLLLGHVSSVLTSAVDNERIPANPCLRATVKSARPKPTKYKAVPFTGEEIDAIESALPARYAILAPLGASLGVRQGELFGISPDDIDWEHETLRLERQVHRIGKELRFGPLKNGTVHTLPLPKHAVRKLRAYLEAFPPREVTLPWTDEKGVSGVKDGTPVTVRLLLTTREKGALNRDYINRHVWAPALKKGGVLHRGMHAMRHHYASTLLQNQVSIKEVSERLNHSDPSLTVRTYTHVMPGADRRTRRALESADKKRRKAAKKRKKKAEHDEPGV